MNVVAIRTAGIYIPLVTGTLSVLGSGSILYSIWARRSTKLKDPQHRILGMMSIFDVLYSLNKALMFLTYPSGLGVPTFGNDATCALQGFFTQFGYAAGSYNLVLSLYYFLIINKGMKKEVFARRWEKVLHGIVVICHLSFAIIGVSIGLFNPTPGFCYITPSLGCKDSSAGECRFGNTAPYFYEAFAQGWIQLAYIAIIVTNLLIWLSVRKLEKKTRKYRVSQLPSRVTQLPSARPSGRMSAMEEKSSHARNVFTQSMLYVCAFMLSWSWATVFHIVAWTTGVKVPWMTLLINIFFPMQGFWNAVIYARPRYNRLKKRHGHLGFRQLVKLSFLPPVEEERGGANVRTSTTVEPDSDFSIFNTFRASLKRLSKQLSFCDRRPPVPVPAIEQEEGEGGSTEEGRNAPSPAALSPKNVEKENKLVGMDGFDEIDL